MTDYLDEAVKRYRTERLPELSPGAQETYDAHLRYWCSKLGHRRLSELHPERIAACRDQLRAEGRKPSSCNRYLAALAAVLTRAVKHWHWLQVNPVGQVAKLPENNARKRFIGTGTRRGEILGLRWRDVDLSAEVFTLADTKNGDSRVLPIPAAVLAILRERKAAADSGVVVPLQDDRFVFPSSVGASASGHSHVLAECCHGRGAPGFPLPRPEAQRRVIPSNGWRERSGYR